MSRQDDVKCFPGTTGVFVRCILHTGRVLIPILINGFLVSYRARQDSAGHVSTAKLHNTGGAATLVDDGGQREVLYST